MTKILAKIYDDSQNCMTIEEDKMFVSRIIRLQTNGSDYKRKIGVINLQGRFLFIRRVRAEHLHKKSNSYGFNHHILANATKFDKIKLADDFGTYVFPVSLVLEQGKFLHFKQQGFERQLFLDLDIIKKHRI